MKNYYILSSNLLQSTAISSAKIRSQNGELYCLFALNHQLNYISGIGKAIASKLAKQGLNVVLVALEDPLLDETFEELKQKYPSIQFRKVGHLTEIEPIKYASNQAGPSICKPSNILQKALMPCTPSLD